MLKAVGEWKMTLVDGLCIQYAAGARKVRTAHGETARFLPAGGGAILRESGCRLDCSFWLLMTLN